MDNILRQIEATLKQEKMYLSNFDVALENEELSDKDREKILIYKECCIEAIQRLEAKKKKIA